MKPYLLAFAVGLLVGILYAVLKVRSPAPPIVALVGLLGILVGEQLPPLAARIAKGHGVGFAAIRSQFRHGMFAQLPDHRAGDPGHDA